MTGSTTRDAGFTIVEFMTGASLAGIILAGVLSSFITLGRSGADALAYLKIDQQTASALRYFSRDVRMASGLTWNSATSVTLTVPDNYAGFGNRVTYAWDNTPGSATYRCFFRTPGDEAAGNPRTILARDVTSFSFARFDRLNAASSKDTTTKRLEVRLGLRASVRTAPGARDDVSASFILRNKPVS
jgi:hypothetical protein